MKFRASYFNNCGTMVRENMRRFWPIPTIGFLIYFLSGAFPILMNYNDPDPLASYIAFSLSNQQPFFMAAHLFLPIIAAVSVFRYLHGVSSVSVMHAMPFTRSALFGSNFMSGLLLSLTPVLANGVTLLLIAKPVYQQQYDYGSSASTSVEAVNVFSRLSVCTWMWESFVLILFIFSVAVFVGIVTGNGLMHFMTALSFQFIVPVLYVTFLEYFRQYLFGFTASGAVTEFFLKLSPFLQIFDARSFTPVISAAYLAVTAAIIGLSLYLYRKRELERAGDALVFPFMQPVICYLITFFTMTLFGLYFSMLEASDFYRYAGYVAGTLIGFLIARMIVKKTVRIFNGHSLKSFAVYCVIAVLFLCGLNFDFTGYERRVPASSDVVSVTLNQGFISETRYALAADSSSSNENNIFKTPDNIELVRWLHQQLLVDRKSYENHNDFVGYDPVRFTYQLRNGSTLSRAYSAPTVLLRSYGQMAPLFESSEYRKRPLIADIPAKDFNYMNISIEDYTDNKGMYVQNTISDKERIHALAQALSMDLTSRTFENMSARAIPLCTLTLGYNGTKKEAILSDARIYQPKTAETILADGSKVGKESVFTVYPDYKNTIAWLKHNGLESYTRPPSDRAKYMKIMHQNDDKKMEFNVETPQSVTNQDGGIPVSDKDNMIITDKDKMASILALCETSPLDYRDSYTVTLVYHLPADGASQGDTIENYTYYMNSEKIPEEILDYFN